MRSVIKDEPVVENFPTDGNKLPDVPSCNLVKECLALSRKNITSPPPPNVTSNLLGMLAHRTRHGQRVAKRRGANTTLVACTRLGIPMHMHVKRVLVCVAHQLRQCTRTSRIRSEVAVMNEETGSFYSHGGGARRKGRGFNSRNTLRRPRTESGDSRPRRDKFLRRSFPSPSVFTPFCRAATLLSTGLVRFPVKD